MAGKVLPEDHQSSDDETAPTSNTDSLASGSTLKDTFWKDLEEGRINLFTTDMYSRVKGECRAARPVSFKDQFKKKLSSKDENGNLKTSPNEEHSSVKQKRLKRRRDKLDSSKKDDHRKTKSRKRLRCRIKSNEFIMLSSSDNSCSDSDGGSDEDKDSVNDLSSTNTVSSNSGHKENSFTNNNHDKFSLVSNSGDEEESSVLDEENQKDLDDDTEKDMPSTLDECCNEQNMLTASCDISHEEKMDISSSSPDFSFQDTNEARTCSKSCDNLKVT